MKLIFLTIFLTGCSHLFYQPAEKHFLDPKQFKLSYEDHYFKSKDKTRLHSWFFPAEEKPAKGTVILFHGNAQNLSTHFLNLVWIVKKKYNLFIFDYRGYGKSKGKPNQLGVYQDALAALEEGQKLNARHGAGKYIVYGQSLGGIVALRALADFSGKDEVDLVVQDSTFASYKRIAFNRMTSRWFLWPLSPIAYFGVSDEFASDKVFDRIRNPLLVIIGEQDHIIPPKFGKEIYREVPSKKKWLWKVKEGRHIDVFHLQDETYREKFLTLIDSLDRF